MDLNTPVNTLVSSRKATDWQQPEWRHLCDSENNSPSGALCAILRITATSYIYVVSPSVCDYENNSHSWYPAYDSAHDSHVCRPLCDSDNNRHEGRPLYAITRTIATRGTLFLV